MYHGNYRRLLLWGLACVVCVAFFRGSVMAGQICTGTITIHNSGVGTIQRCGFQCQYAGGICDGTWFGEADSAVTISPGGTHNFSSICTSTCNPGSTALLRSLWYTNDINGNPVTTHPFYGDVVGCASGANVTLEVLGGQPAACTNYVNLIAYNVTGLPRRLQLVQNGVGTDVGVVEPGNSGAVSLSVSCGGESTVYLRWADDIHDTDGTKVGTTYTDATPHVDPSGWSATPNPDPPSPIPNNNLPPGFQPWNTDGNTNVVINFGTNYQGGTNVAMNATLATGFDALYGAIKENTRATAEGTAGETAAQAAGNAKEDTGNTFLGRIANATETTAGNTGVMTNQLGGIANSLVSINNGIGVMTNQLGRLGDIATNTAAATNLLGAMTNQLGFLTNLFGGTNGGIYAGTNVTDMTNGGFSASGPGSSAFASFSNAFTPPEHGSFDAGDWSVDIGSDGFAHHLDLNPLHDDRLAAVAAWIRAACVWVFSISFLWGCMNVFEKYYVETAAARQAQSAGTTNLGTNANTLVALAVAAAITVTLLAVPLFLFGYFYAFGLGFVQTHIFSGYGGVVGMGLGLLDGFFPLDLLVTLPVLAFGFRAGIGGVYWVSTTVVRFLVG